MKKTAVTRAASLGSATATETGSVFRRYLLVTNLEKRCVWSDFGLSLGRSRFISGFCDSTGVHSLFMLRHIPAIKTDIVVAHEWTPLKMATTALRASRPSLEAHDHRAPLPLPAESIRAATARLALPGKTDASRAIRADSVVTGWSPTEFSHDLANEGSRNRTVTSIISFGRGSRIRTCDLKYPKLPRYRAALYPDGSARG